MKTIDHSGPKSLRPLDPDGDGAREAHRNAQEGLWTGPRDFLRPSRGVVEWSPARYVASFRWAHNIKRVSDEFLRALIGWRPGTGPAP